MFFRLVSTMDDTSEICLGNSHYFCDFSLGFASVGDCGKHPFTFIHELRLVLSIENATRKMIGKNMVIH